MTEKKHQTPEGIAAKECADAARDLIQGWTGAEVAVAAFGQAQQTQAAINGLIYILLQKGKLSASDLGDAMKYAYHERCEQLKAQREKSLMGGAAIYIPPPPTARGN